MGYNLYITRREDWADDGNEITSDEWLTLVKRDPELRITTEWHSNGAYFTVWSGANPSASEWLDWSNGTIYSKYPSVLLIDKMLNIAEQFGANVQGDDGERYTKLPRPLQIGDHVQNDHGDRKIVVGFVEEGREAGMVLVRGDGHTSSWTPQSLTLLDTDTN